MTKDKFQFDLTPEDIKVFLDEADEVLQLLDEGILKLEQQGEDLETIQEIFRAAHTLKGSSATLGHTKMAEVTHHLETVFDRVREGQILVSTDLIDVLLSALDVLKRFKEDIAQSCESTLDCSDLISKLCVAASGELSGETAAGQTINAQEEAPIDEALKDLINSEEIKGNMILEVKFKLVDDCAMPAVRAFQAFEELNGQGQILKSDPTEEDVSNGKCGLEGLAIFSTQESDVQLMAVLNSIPDIENVHISPLAAGTTHEETSDRPVETADTNAQGIADVKLEPNKIAEKQARTVRVDVKRLDKLMNLVGELVISRTQLSEIGDFLLNDSDQDEARKVLGEASTRIGKITNELQEEIVKARMLPIERVFNKFPRMVRDLAKKCDKQINFIVSGKETELDRSVIEEIGDPLIHILRNAVDHGIETKEEREAAGKPEESTVKLSARHQEGQILIEVEDDGKGIDLEQIKTNAIKNGIVGAEQASRISDQEAIQLIFYSGVSTAKEVTHLSGRGVGMDIVRSNIEKINGTIEVSTQLGKGSVFTIKLPLTLAIVQALLVNTSNHIFAIPLNLVIETVRLYEHEIKYISKRETIVLRGSVLPLLRLSNIFDFNQVDERKAFVVVASFGGNKVGFIVDNLIGEREIVIKTLGNYISSAKGISGATILGDGRVALIVDVPSLINMIIREQKFVKEEV